MKHLHYLTGVFNFETGRVVWVGQGRDTSTLETFYSQMPPDVRLEYQVVVLFTGDATRM